MLETKWALGCNSIFEKEMMRLGSCTPRVIFETIQQPLTKLTVCQGCSELAHVSHRMDYIHRVRQKEMHRQPSAWLRILAKECLVERSIPKEKVKPRCTSVGSMGAKGLKV